MTVEQIERNLLSLSNQVKSMQSENETHTGIAFWGILIAFAATLVIHAFYEQTLASPVDSMFRWGSILFPAGTILFFFMLQRKTKSKRENAQKAKKLLDDISVLQNQIALAKRPPKDGILTRPQVPLQTSYNQLISEAMSLRSRAYSGNDAVEAALYTAFYLVGFSSSMVVLGIIFGCFQSFLQSEGWTAIGVVAYIIGVLSTLFLLVPVHTKYAAGSDGITSDAVIWALLSFLAGAVVIIIIGMVVGCVWLAAWIVMGLLTLLKWIFIIGIILLILRFLGSIFG